MSNLASKFYFSTNQVLTTGIRLKPMEQVVYRQVYSNETTAGYRVVSTSNKIIAIISAILCGKKYYNAFCCLHM